MLLKRHNFSLAPPLPPLQAFGQTFSTQRKVAADGETNEETLLQESATNEAYYMSRLLGIQSELKQSRAVTVNTQADNEHLSTLLQELREVRHQGLEVRGEGFSGDCYNDACTNSNPVAEKHSKQR